MSTAEIEKLRSLGGSYMFDLEIRRLSEAAAQDDAAALETLEQMLRDGCRDWMKDSYWCSAAIRGLVLSESARSMEIVLDYIKNSSAELPYGVIELFASLLPVYGGAVLPHLREMAKAEEASPIRAVGIQALCNVYLEGRLEGEDLQFLKTTIRDFMPDRYMTHHVVDLVHSYLVGSQRIVDSNEMDEIFKDVIVES